MNLEKNDDASERPLDLIVMPRCCSTVDVTKLCGGGTMWYYAMCKCGRVLGASHEDDKSGMRRLTEIKRHNTKIIGGTSD